MANENQSRDNPSRQQSAERSQTGSSQQGTGGQHTSYAQGAQQGQGSRGTQGQGNYSQGSSGRAGGQGAMSRSGQGSGTSTWAGGRQGGLQPRGTSSPSPSPYYGGTGYGSGPFSIMRRISDEMDRLFENFGMGRSLFPSPSGQGQGTWDVGGYNEGMQAMWSPHIEVSERNGKLMIQADLPGMKRDDIHVRVEDDEVVIQGERRNESSGSQGGYYRSERSYGSFYRTIPLPEGTNADTANATFRDGVLEIEFDLPRQAQRGRTLSINDGTSQQSRSGTGSGQTYGSGHTGSLEGASSGGTGTSGSGGTMHTGANPSSGPMHGGSTSGTGSAATSGQHVQSGTSGSYGAGMSGSTGSQHSASGGATGTQQHVQSGTGGSAGGGIQQSSGGGTMYSGSGNPSVGAAGIGASHGGGASDRSTDKSSKS